MGIADLLILAVVGVSALIGLWRGLLTEVLSVLFWIAAVVLSLWFGSTVAAWFTGIDSHGLRLVLAHVVVFVGTLVVGGVVLWMLRKLVQGSGLSGTDRTLGLVFGIARGVLVLAVGVLALGYTAAPASAAWQESRLLPVVDVVAGWMRNKLPDWASDNNATGAPNAAEAVLAPPEEN